MNRAARVRQIEPGVFGNRMSEVTAEPRGDIVTHDLVPRASTLFT